MIKSVLKILALGGSILVGGGVLLGSNLSPAQQFKENEMITVSSPQIPKSCNIYEAEEPIWWLWRRAFLKLTRRFDGQEEFFKDLGGKTNVWNIDELKEKIGARCNQRKNVYLWYGYGGDRSKGKTWIYAKDMNEEGYDWARARSVRGRSGSVVED